jgi:hypothetical protein
VFGNPTPACVTEVCAFDAFVEALVVRFQQKFVDEALPEAMLQSGTIFNALTSLDGVLAAKLQEASLAAQAALERDSREQGIQLQFAPYARLAGTPLTSEPFPPNTIFLPLSHHPSFHVSQSLQLLSP